MTTTIATMIQAWLAGMKRQHKSHNTLKSHAHATNLFMTWLVEQPAKMTLPTLDLAVLEQYVLFLRNHRRDPPLEHRTIRAYIDVLVRWLQWLVDTDQMPGILNDDNRSIKPAAVRDILYSLLDKPEPLTAPRIPDLRRLPSYYQLKQQEFRARYGELGPAPEPAHRRNYLNIMRNRALVATLFSTGARISEVLSLTVEQMQRHGRIVSSTKITGKGRKRRPLRFDDLSRTWIADYLAARVPWYPTVTAVFISNGPKANGKRMSVDSAERVVKEAALWLAGLREVEGAQREEIDKLHAVSPHSLRHYLAQAMLDEGAEYQDISAVLGHSSTVVTQQVYAAMDDQRTLEVANTFAPRADLSDVGRYVR